jgi:hypothetical protein
MDWSISDCGWKRRPTIYKLTPPPPEADNPRILEAETLQILPLQVVGMSINGATRTRDDVLSATGSVDR